MRGTEAGLRNFPLMLEKKTTQPHNALSGSDPQPAAGAGAPLARPGHTCWKLARATRTTLIVDAADYFRAAKQAMLTARHSIMLLGWDFDVRVEMEPDGKTLEGPNRIGRFLNWLARSRPDLSIHLLKWDIGALYALGRGQTPLFLFDWLWAKNVHFRLDRVHPPLGAHHMKLLVVDDAIAFCGGIDMTQGRWDRRTHTEADPARRTPRGRLLPPWHDATSCVTGPAAKALGELARQRWQKATGETLAPPPEVAPVWPQLVTDMREVDVAIARTVARTVSRHGDWPQIGEIRKLTFAMIAAARHSLYIENQYLASRRIAEALAKRLRQPEGPEVVLVMPLVADGWLEAKTMDSARVRLMHLLKRADRHGRLRLYYPVNDAGTPIYVHAKIMIADDAALKIGSANLNNRSMGYDTECDLMIEAAGQSDPEAVRMAIRQRRDDLIGEHLGVEPARFSAMVQEKGSLIAAIEALNAGKAGRGGRGLLPLPLRELTAEEEFFAETDLVDPERPRPFVELVASLWRGRRRRKPTHGAARRNGGGRS